MPDFLNRSEADFPASIWERLDAAVVETARQKLVGRRFLPLDGPHGLGLKLVTRRAEERCTPKGADGNGGVCISVGGGLPVPLVYSEFDLGVRDVEAHVRFGQPFDVTPAIRAAARVAEQEERLIFFGEPAAQIPGLLNAPGAAFSELSDWAHQNQAIEDLIRAVTLLDKRGISGQYALALAPDLYNSLFHKYSDSDLLRIEHLRSLIREGLFKSSVLEPGTGVLLVNTGDVARLVLGEDLKIAYRRIDGMFHRFMVVESLVVDVIRPEGICILRRNG
jgi:uncharacterized linocin/CFP29 family protein